MVTMPHSESPGSSPPVPTPTSEEMEAMEHDQAQDGPVKTEPQEDETDGDITMADVNPMPASEDTKKDVKLEDLFVDDSDDEFPGTGKTTQSQPLSTSSPGPDSAAEQK